MLYKDVILYLHISVAGQSASYSLSVPSYYFLLRVTVFLL